MKVVNVKVVKMKVGRVEGLKMKAMKVKVIRMKVVSLMMSCSQDYIFKGITKMFFRLNVENTNNR